MSDTFEQFKNDMPDFVKNADDFELYKLRHTTEHVFNQAIEELWPGRVIRAIGPAIAEGFYNDSRWALPPSETDFERIESKMQEIIDADFPIVRKDITIDEAKELFKDNPFKQELINEFVNSGEMLSVYWTGDKFVDLCKGPHMDSTGSIKSFKVLSIAGAYWRGDEKNEMLTRIYGTAFNSKEELEKYIWQKEEAKKRDHRKLGQQLDLFSFSDLVGSGMPLYTQRGALIRRLLNEYVEELQRNAGYMQVWTPQIARGELFKTSGHYDKYKDDMFRVSSSYSDDEFFLKPMNCPQHTQIYSSRPRSYRELPLRITDFAMLYRDERPGELHGLARVRSFSQDDCHVFCREDQVDAEIDLALSMIKEVLTTFGFKYRYRLSTRDPQHPEKYLGDPQTWDKVEKWAEDIMVRNNIEHYPGVGEAAFYAPKMDLMATDSIGREWQLSTVQIDYVMPERFDLKYIDKDGIEKRPVMIHRAILGSAERFMMILLESMGGALPVWLSPVQVKIIPISDQNIEYAQKLDVAMKGMGIRSEIDSDSERMQNKIRQAQEMKTPYMLIVGKQEEDNQTVSVRLRTGEETKGVNFEDFVNRVKKNISDRKLEITL